MKMKRLISLAIALLLVCGMPVSVFAAEYDLAVGSVTVTATADGQTVTHGTNDAVQDDAPVIIQSNNETATTNTITIKAEGSATANVTIQDVNIVISDPTDAPPVDHSGEAAVTIDVAENASANVIMDGVNINVGETGSGHLLLSGEAAVQITGNGDVTLELDGENTVQGGNYRSGVEKNNGGKLTITDENGTSGSLEATGGASGSGIGGGWLGNGSNITITGSAEVTATGGASGSGIGGGVSGNGSNITIEGDADVTAKGGDFGSGIGGGWKGSGSDITITGSAEVTAEGGVSGAGIGGGYNGNGNGTGSNITLSRDAQVKAQGGNTFNLDKRGIYYGAGAAIGDGGKYSGSSPDNIAGEEKKPNTEGLNEGWIATYDPSITNLDTVPDSLTYRDDRGTVTTEEDSQKIQTEEAVSATADTHGHEAGFMVGNEMVAVTTHYYDNYVSNDDATCTHDGTKTATCTVPGCTATHTVPAPGSMLKHEFGEYVPDANNLATCTKAGTKTAKCKHCTATDTVIDPIKDHSIGEYYTDTPATCQKEGVEQRDCENCNYYETRPLKKVDHSYGDFSSDNNATCTADGTKTRKCIWCDLPDTIPDPGTMKEHSFTNYIYDNNATYSGDGTKTAKCDHCDATDTIPAPGTRLPFYKVKGQDGAGLPCEEERQDGVLTITVDADCASLTGTFGGIKALKARGVDTIVFVTKGAGSTFAIEDLLAQGASGDTYSLTHDGSTVTFTLGNGTDMSKILK